MSRKAEDSLACLTTTAEVWMRELTTAAIALLFIAGCTAAGAQGVKRSRSAQPRLDRGVVRVATRLTRADYEDRVHAAWIAQMLACMMGWQFEHQVASTEWVDKFPKPYIEGPIDDDWY